MDNVDNVEVKTALYLKMPELELLSINSLCVDKTQKIHIEIGIYARFNVDNVDNYCLSRSSPTFEISPAPIVINRSPFILFFNKNFSISKKEEK